MNITSQEISLIHRITEFDDSEALKMFEKSTKPKLWNNLSDAEKLSVGKGLSDLKEGRTIAHSEVKKRYEKWLI
jgi:hypothetical protein